ncbi:type II secretion system protein GspG [Phycisphaerales bacterium ac7]|nr:type II secretion system GspH family protein [bacterium]
MHAPTQPIRRTARRAFTIIELMVVLLLIGVLMGIAAINLPGVINRGKEKATRASMQVIATALQEYQMEHGYPSNNGLQVLVDQQYLTKPSDLEDSWDQPIEFLAPSQVGGTDVAYTLRSAGKDQQFDTPDDIIYWPGMDD